MKRIFDHIRDRLFSDETYNLLMNIKISDSYETLKNTEWVPEFERLMRNRLIIGAIRYQTFEEKNILSKGRQFFDVIRYAKDKLDIYLKTGNLEGLVDAANLCMIEFDTPSHSNPHLETIEAINRTKIIQK